MTQIKIIRILKKPQKRILFLGYGEEKTRLIKFLMEHNCEVYHSVQHIDDFKYDIIISFGYRYILEKNFIESCKCPIINLHISYLPFNRGAHPNFWSFYDNTQSGVSIHLIDEGIDTGPILFQKKVHFKQEVTFYTTYKKLIYEIEELFISNINDIIKFKWVEKPQISKGTFHLKKDLPNNFKGWNSNINSEIKRLKKK